MLKKYLIVERESDIKKFSNIKQISDNLFENFKNNFLSISKRNINIEDEVDAFEKIFYTKIKKNELVFITFDSDSREGTGLYNMEYNIIEISSKKVAEIQNKIYRYVLKRKDNLSDKKVIQTVLKAIDDMESAFKEHDELSYTLYHELVHAMDHEQYQDDTWFDKSVKKFLNRVNELGGFNNMSTQEYGSSNHEMNAHLVEFVKDFHQFVGGKKVNEVKKEFELYVGAVCDHFKFSGRKKKSFIIRFFLLYSYLTDSQSRVDSKVEKVKNLI